MEKYLVIVESPTKAKTIRKFLPKNYIIEASMGHIRDLPQSATEIPADLKKEEWAKIGVNVEKDFEPLYVVSKGKSKIVRELKAKLKEVDALYLATDEDREGESISWHLLELLKPKVPTKRMVFHEITKTAIEKALKDCRDVDMKLVRAQETRRIVDRLYGYTLSPLIWKKIAFGLSAGRVQSTGMKMITERELERIRFKSSSYWDLKATLKKGEQFDAKLITVAGQKIAQGRDFDATTGALTGGKNVLLLDEKKAKQLAEKVKSANWKVLDIEEKESISRPAIPFITSTLQQEGNRKLGLSAKDTMRVAQKLYEEGLITYMRTDSPNLSNEAINGARKGVEKLYGKDYLSPAPRQFSAKTKGAQEAHEAIRPAGSEFVHPDDTGLSGRERSLYELIWKRTMATQMADAIKASMTVKIGVDDAEFQANGSRIIFPGFLRVYVEGHDDPEAALEDREVILPKMAKGDALQMIKIDSLDHVTMPPARFTEASLVQRLEKEGIGRPSTYASIIGTIIDRGYVRKVGNALVPSFTGMAVANLLDKYFAGLVDYKFTSQMEESLDDIATGEKDWLKYLKEFYLGKKGLQEQVKTQDKVIKPEDGRTIHLPQLPNLEIKVGRFGPYVVAGGKGKDEVHASIPEDLAPADLKEEDIETLLTQSKKGPTPIGVDPKTGKNIYCLVGRYGAYVQLGEVVEGSEEKPRRASLPATITPKDMTLEIALSLLALPRDLGVHPTTKKPIVANNGRFGPYVMHDGEFRSLKKTDDVYTIDLTRAVELLSEEKKGRGSKVLVDLGTHPKDKKKLSILDGAYGPYIKHGTKNLSLPEELKDAEKAKSLTLAQVLEIIGGDTKETKVKKTKKA